MSPAVDATAGEGRLQPRRVALIAAVTVAGFVIVALLTVLVGAGKAATDGFDQEFLAACRRSDAPQERCRCALGEWNRTLEAGARRDLENTLADDGDLPVSVQSALARC